MNPDEKNTFAALMTSVAELHGKKLSAPLLEIYWRALMSYRLVDIQQALNVHVVDPDSGRFMPKPADISRALQGSSSDKALIAWTKVMHAIQEIGSYASITFDDPLVHAVVAAMEGWVELCIHTQKELLYRGQEFQKRYAAYLQQQPTTYSKYLIGIEEHINSQRGYPSQLPVLYGDTWKALEVYQRGMLPQKLAYEKSLPLEKLLAQVQEAEAARNTENIENAESAEKA